MSHSFERGGPWLESLVMQIDRNFQIQFQFRENNFSLRELINLSVVCLSVCLSIYVCV